MPAVGRRAPGEEPGFTLTEVLVVSVLTLVVLIMGYQILNATTNTIKVVSYEASNAADARIAVADLEANLRYANGFWINTTNTTLTVSNSATTAFKNQPLCAQWTLTTKGLDEATDSTGTALGTPALVMQGVSSLSFTTPLTNLVRIDLTENPQAPSTTNAVSVHDLITPDNLSTSLVTTTQCV